MPTKQQLMQVHRWLVKRGKYSSASIVLSYMLGNQSLFNASCSQFWFSAYSLFKGGL